MSVKSWLGRRNNLGMFGTFLQELRFESKYKEPLRITVSDFDKVLGLIQDDIPKQTPMCVIQTQICVTQYQKTFFATGEIRQTHITSFKYIHVVYQGLSPKYAMQYIKNW